MFNLEKWHGCPSKNLRVKHSIALNSAFKTDIMPRANRNQARLFILDWTKYNNRDLFLMGTLQEPHIIPPSIPQAPPAHQPV